MIETPRQRGVFLSEWSVYIVRCADGTLYTGITRDVRRRVDEHNSVFRGALGARYTRSRQPVILVYCEPADSRSMAARRENEIKRLTRAQKEALLLSAGEGC